MGHNPLPSEHRSHPRVRIEVLCEFREVGEAEIHCQQHHHAEEMGEERRGSRSAEDDFEDGEEAVQTVYGDVDESDIRGCSGPWDGVEGGPEDQRDEERERRDCCMPDCVCELEWSRDGIVEEGDFSSSSSTKTDSVDESMPG